MIRVMDPFFRECRTPPPIVIVDDDAAFAELLREGIRDAGYRPICACDGREGLTAIMHEKPAMVLIDIEMPEMNGSELLAKIDRSPALARIPRAVLTGDSNFTFGDSPSWPIFRKPICLERLLSTIRRFVDQPPHSGRLLGSRKVHAA